MTAVESKIAVSQGTSVVANAGPTETGGSVGAHTTRGVFWTLLFSIMNKVVAMGAQVGIAWFLSPKDIGLVATATSVVGVLSLLLGGQLQRVLIQRQRSFEEDAGQVFWLSLGMNLALAGVIAVSATMLSRLFGDPKLKELLWIVAAAIPLMAVPVAYGAKLFIDLRFKLMSVLAFGEGLIRNLGGVLLAGLGFGPSSLVIPLFFSSLFACVVQRKAAGSITFGRPNPLRWKPLLAPTFWLMITAFLTSGIGYGTNLIIAASHPMEVAGLYYWGFSMSAQAVFLLVTNLQGILFPAFASMGESVERQRTAFEQTTAVLTLVVVPITCLQVLLAQPVVALLFQPRWLPAVPVIQWLSVGMLTQPLNVVGVAILMARGEYRKTACVTAVMALFTLAAALLGSHLGEEKQIAQLVSIATLVTNVLPGWTAYRSLGGDGRRLWHILAGPILLGIPLAVFGFLVNEAVVRLNPLLRIFSVSLAAAVIYGALVRWRSPEFLTIVFLRLRQLREKK